MADFLRCQVDGRSRPVHVIEIIHDFEVGAQARDIEVVVKGLDAHQKGRPSGGADITVTNGVDLKPQEQV